MTTDNTDPEFTYGDGFTGRTYYVNGIEVYHNDGDTKEAREKAIQYLKENGIVYEGEIIFKWDGTM